MSAHVTENQLALYAGGDLDPVEAGAVAAHLGECEACRASLAAFEQLETLLKMSFAEPEADELSAVRRKIREKLSRKHQRRGWKWAWAAAAAAVAVVTSLVSFESRAPKAEVPVVAQVPPPPVPAMRFVETPHLERTGERRERRSQAGLHTVALITRADAPPLIRMTTADPNVVILWQSKQEENE